MTDTSKLVILKQLIETAENSLHTAKELLAELGINGEISKIDKSEFVKKAKSLEKTTQEPNIIEGVFDGQNMISADKRGYPVPANYASKSKLVPGDVLKLTIKDDGTFIYKQIGPVERTRVVGVLLNDESQYKVITGEKSYKVLLASVTYFHADVGDRVTIIVPAKGESEWGSIENVLPSEISET